MKKPWSEWAVLYVRQTGKCPGDVPPFGSPDDLVTEGEFKQSVQALGTHKYCDCHFTDKLLGYRKDDDVKEVTIGDDVAVKQKAADVSGRAVGMIQENKIRVLKKKLHEFVDKIKMKGGGVLYVPSELLELRDYIDEEVG